MLRPLLPILLLAATGCRRDPVFVGYWDIVRAERQGRGQADVGFLDFDGDGNVTFFTRYLWTGDAWAPDPSPEVRTSPTSVFTQDDVFEAYQEEGETFDVRIDLLQAEPLTIDDYHPWRAELSGPSVWWPRVSGEIGPAPGADVAGQPTSLVIRR